MRGIDINELYMTSSSIKEHNVTMLIKIQESEKEKYKRVKRMKLNPYFSN